MSKLEHVQSIELDFSDAYYPLGSCRMFELGWNSVLKTAKKALVTGLRNEEEKKTFMNIWVDVIGPAAEEIDQHQLG